MAASRVSAAPVAVILAAGMGTRLQTVHDERPKGFVQIGSEPVIARSVRLLQQAGIDEFVFVVGWRGDHYRSWLAEHVAAARVVENAAYATTGSLRSLRIGAETVPGRPLLIVESDLLFERRAAVAMVARAERSELLVSGFTAGGDEVWVYGTADGRLEHLTKQRRSGSAPCGELVGLTRLTAGAVDALRGAESTLPPGAHYEDGLNVICGTQPIGLRHIPDLVWCEIDDPAHLNRARSSVWPRVVAADSMAAPA